MPAQAEQAAQNQGHIGAEYAPVGVAFIDDDELQVAQHPRPPRVRGQHGHVHHIGIGKHQARMIAHARPGFQGRIAVIGRGHHVFELRNPAAQLERGLQLVRSQGLGGGEVERARGLILCQPGEDGQLVAQGFAGRGAGRNHGVAALPRAFGELGLVRIELADAPIHHLLLQPRQHPLRPIGVARPLCRERGVKCQGGLRKAPLDEF